MLPHKLRGLQQPQSLVHIPAEGKATLQSSQGSDSEGLVGDAQLACPAGHVVAHAGCREGERGRTATYAVKVHIWQASLVKQPLMQNGQSKHRKLKHRRLHSSEAGTVQLPGAEAFSIGAAALLCHTAFQDRRSEASTIAGLGAETQRD